MTKHFSTIASFGALALAAGCATSGIGGTAEPTEQAVTRGDDKPHHPRGLCTASDTLTAPASGLVTNFSEAGGAGGDAGQIPGGIVTYSVPKLVTPGAFSSTTTGGQLNIKINAPATSRPQLLGTLEQFNSCVDASAFTGVQFTIRGSFSDCSLVYGTGDVQHEDVTLSSTFASGPAGSYVPQHKLSASDLSATPRTLKLPFARTDVQGNPPKPIDPTQLIFALWQFIVPIAADDGSATPPCLADVTIDDVQFYR
jgi:hypothetical protein